MFVYVCPDCKGRQFSSSSEKAHEPCIYCGKTDVRLAGAASCRPGDDDRIVEVALAKASAEVEKMQ